MGDLPPLSIDPAELAELRAFAVDAATLAGRAALERAAAGPTVERKADRTFVTDADRAGEEILRARLAARCPLDGVIGEEYGVVEGETGRRWTLDPIDGTYAFVHGVPTWSVLVGLLVGPRAALGVIHLPALGETVDAAVGLGCRWTAGGRTRDARVSDTPALAGALVLATALNDVPVAALAADGADLRTWGDGWGYALVATGRADAMVDPAMHVWDSAPLQPVVEEAGGRFTTLEGAAVPDGGSALATNGRLHDALLARLGRAGGG